MDVDRYWYSFAQQHGASYANVYQYYRFDQNGVQGTVPVEFQNGENYTITGANAVIPGMQMNVTVAPNGGYALKSITINGEEYIQKANFNEDGSVTITERGVAGGVKISAEAEPITDGNKSLSGRVIAHKLGGGSLENVDASYKGPTGERPLELDAQGNFTLENLKQGYYTIIMAKEGYQKLTRNIYVNRDMQTELSLEYDLFASTAYGWVLDDQNSGVLHKFGGSGELLTNDSYQAFTASATFHFDPALEQSGTTDSFTQQRQGFQFAFSNEKIWHVDLMKENGKYYVQYAKHSGDKSMTGWKKIYTLTAGEVAKFTGKQGVTLSVKREGKFANVYLDGKVIAMEILDNAYASASVQIGFEAWAANREIARIPFNITRGAGLDWREQFTVEATYKFSTALEKAGATAGYTEQRQGLQILFSNGKIWHIDLLKQNGKYVVQYAKHSDDKSMTGWKKIYTLTDQETANYTGSKGVTLSVLRDGKYANVYLDGKLIALEILDDSFASAAAQIAPESWVANADTKNIPLQIKNSTDVDLKNLFFLMKDGWDVGGQYTGTVAMPQGGTGRLTFMDKQGNMSLSVIARDYSNSQDAEGVYPRTDILFVFDNGKQMSFGIDGKGTNVQSMYDESAADKYINAGWKTWGNLTAAEITQLRGDGLQFKVVRYGTEVTLYLGNRMVAVADLTANNSGITANMSAEVSIRHYDDTGVRVEIPFDLSHQFDTVKLTTDKNVVAQKQQYLVGDTVKIQAKDPSYYITALQINGQDVQVGLDGTYSFTATEKTYSITGVVEKSVFQPDSQWNLQQQNDGVISIPVRVGDYASLYTTDSIYRDAAVTIKDYAPSYNADGKGNFQMQIRFIFANGKQYQVRLHNTDADGKYKIQTMGGDSCITGWKWHKDLTVAQTEKLQKDGIEFRMVLVDASARFYLDGVEVASYDLKTAYQNHGLQITDAAQIHLMMYGNTGVENVVIPYALSTEFVEKVTWNITDGSEKVAATTESGKNYVSVVTDNRAYREASVVVKDLDPTFGADGKGNFQMQIRFIFANGKQYQLRLHNTDADGKYKLQNMGGDNCITGWKWLVDLNAEQTNALQTGDGVVLRVVLVGSNAQLYLDDTLVATIDLSSGGVNADALAQIRFVMYGNTNVPQMNIPCTVGEGPAVAKIYTATNGNGAVTVDKSVCLVGDTVTITATPANGYNLKSLVVKEDGQVIKTFQTKLGGGSYTFTDTLEGEYTVEGEFAKSLFKFQNDTDKGCWNVDEQYSGLLTILGKTKTSGGYARILTTDNTYREVSVNVRDQQSGVFKMQIYFVFTNGKQLQLRLDNEAGYYRVQNMSSSIISSWTNVVKLSNDQTAKLQSEAGMNFRIQIVGTNAIVYLDDVQVGSLSLSAGITADMTASITMIMYGNDGVEPIDIPFTLG